MIESANSIITSFKSFVKSCHRSVLVQPSNRLKAICFNDEGSQLVQRHLERKNIYFFSYNYVKVLKKRMFSNQNFPIFSVHVHCRQIGKPIQFDTSCVITTYRFPQVILAYVNNKILQRNHTHTKIYE